LTKIITPNDWQKQYKYNGIVIEPREITENEKITFYISFVNKIINLLKNEFSEIDIIENDHFINKNIKLLCTKKKRFIHIKIYVNIGYKRQGYLFLEFKDSKSLFHTNIYFTDEDEHGEQNKYREYSIQLINKMMDKLNGFCGTIRLESNVNDIFKIGDLWTNTGDKSNYGIENVFWKI